MMADDKKNDETPVDEVGAETAFTPDDRELSDDAGTFDLFASSGEQPGEDEVDAQAPGHDAGPDDPITLRDGVEDEGVAAQMFSDEQDEIWGDVDPAGTVMPTADGDGHVVEPPEGSDNGTGPPR